MTEYTKITASTYLRGMGRSDLVTEPAERWGELKTGGSTSIREELIGGPVEPRPIWKSGCMEAAVLLDIDVIRSACERFGVDRLRIFGSVLTDRFNPETSDFDFLVTFQPARENLFHDYFDLKFELERIVGQGVDLVTERSLKNPFSRRQSSRVRRTYTRREAGAHF